MKHTSTCNRTHAADACCAPATQSAFCTASYLFALDTAILAVSILLSVLLGGTGGSGDPAGSDRTGTNYSASRSKAQRQWFRQNSPGQKSWLTALLQEQGRFSFCIFKPTG